MSISRRQRLTIITSVVAISIAISVNQFMVLLPEAMLGQSDRQVIASAMAICDRDGYTKCYKITKQRCKVQMGLSARVCLRQPLHDCAEGEPLATGQECYGEINECILARHYVANAHSGLEGAGCVANVLYETAQENP